MGRVGGLAVALGVGAAIVSGWSSGLAWADDSPGSAGSPASSNTAGPDVATAKPSASGDEADSSGATTATSTATTGTDVPCHEGWIGALGASGRRRRYGWSQAG